MGERVDTVASVRNEMMAISRCFYKDPYALRNTKKTKTYREKMEALQERAQNLPKEKGKAALCKVLTKAVKYLRGSQFLRREALLDWASGKLTADQAEKVMDSK